MVFGALLGAASKVASVAKKGAKFAKAAKAAKGSKGSAMDMDLGTGPESIHPTGPVGVGPKGGNPLHYQTHKAQQKKGIKNAKRNRL